MNEKIELLGLEIDNLSLDDAVEQTAEFLRTDSLSTVGLISSGVLVEAVKVPGWTEKARLLDMTLIGDMEMYQAARNSCRLTPLDISEKRYLNEVFAYVAEHELEVALLVERKADKQIFQKYMKKQYRGLNIVDAFSLDEVTKDEDNIVNLLNAAAEDVLVAAVTSPAQEDFLGSSRQKLGAKLYIGIGKTVAMLEGGESKVGFLGKMIEKRIFKRKVSQYQNEKGE